MNEDEKKVWRKYEDNGYDIIHIGIPDFLLLKNGFLEFVEVKSSKNKLSDNQQRAFNLLQKHGFKVRVERVKHVEKGPAPLNIFDIVKMTRAGQITLPKDMREEMGWVDGTKLRFLIEGQRVILCPVKGDE